jgi:hypothetical protein
MTALYFRLPVGLRGRCGGDGQPVPAGRLVSIAEKARLDAAEKGVPDHLDGALRRLGHCGDACRLSDDPAPGLALWSVQIALNTLWTPVFFGAHRMATGMAVIALLWLVLAASPASCSCKPTFGRGF